MDFEACLGLEYQRILPMWGHEKENPLALTTSSAEAFEGLGLRITICQKPSTRQAFLLASLRSQHILYIRRCHFEKRTLVLLVSQGCTYPAKPPFSRLRCLLQSSTFDSDQYSPS